jgi:DHA1 family bicyclomycin/chloramphenicol resistance-like MFS transporter
MIMPTKPVSQGEFIALIAMLFATIAFSIDAMLPALPEIGAELSPANLNRAQLVLTSFVLGMGIGTFFAGPLSDSFGRKPVIFAGAALYILAAALAFVAPSLELLLAARVVQGIGAAGPRVVSVALVRDLHSGRQMARVISFAMMIFTVVPAIAPLLGAAIMGVTGWRGIFPAFILFAAVAMAWLMLRQPETLPRPARRPLQARPLWQALTEVLAHPIVRSSLIVQTLCFAVLFGTLSSTQPLFETTFARADEFPMWFALIAVLSGGASLINAALVVRLGMRRMVSVTLLAQTGLSLGFALLWQFGGLTPGGLFPVYLLWTVSLFFVAGLTLGNLNAIALEPMGHIAGMAASATGAIATVASVAIAAPIGLAFNGTPLPLALSTAGLCALGVALMQRMPAASPTPPTRA